MERGADIPVCRPAAQAPYSLLTREQVLDWPAFCSRLLDEASPLHRKAWDWLSPDLQQSIGEAAAGTQKMTPKQQDALLRVLNTLLKRPDAFEEPPEPNAKHWLGQRLGRRLNRLLQRCGFGQRYPGESGREVERRNRLLLDAMCPGLIKKGEEPPATVERVFKDVVDRYLRSDFPSPSRAFWP